MGNSMKQVKVVVTLTVKKSMSDDKACALAAFFLESEDWVEKATSELFVEVEE